MHKTGSADFAFDLSILRSLWIYALPDSFAPRYIPERPGSHSGFTPARRTRHGIDLSAIPLPPGGS